MFQVFRWFSTRRSTTDTVLFYLAWLLHLPLLFFLLYSLLDTPLNWRNIAGNVMAIFVSFVPRWMESRSRYRFPALGEFCLSLALLVETFGRTFHLYEGNPLPYDKFSHAAIVGALTCFAILLLYAFFLEYDVEYDSWLIVVVGVLFGFGIGGLWEAYEWAADELFGTNFQHGNWDTMTDLITGATGALLGSFAARWYRKQHSRAEVMDEIPIFYKWF